MSQILGCDYECQRKNNLNKLREIYESELNNYYNTYNQYLSYKYDRSNDRAWKMNYAETTLKPQVERINTTLNNILNELKRNIKETEQLIKSQEKTADSKTDLIYRKNKIIEIQDSTIKSNNQDLISKDRQIQFTLERNRYRRTMMIILVTINIVLLSIFYYYLMKQ